MSERPRIVVLGGGPAGAGAALFLAERGFAVDLLERGPSVGGNAGSFDLAGFRVDFGSHRLHPRADPAILDRLRGLLGGDLLTRPRHGRIRLLGRWIHFPLRPVDLALRSPRSFALGAALDAARKALRGTGRPAGDEETFASVLEAGLGPTICRAFYFPYARKIWGLAPAEISAEQARRRVSASSVGAILRRLLPFAGDSREAGLKKVFHYPRRGFGQITEALAEAAVAAGAGLHLGAEVRGLERRPEGGWEVVAATADGERRWSADRVFSTVPARVLVETLRPAAPAEVLAAARGLESRAMVLVYLVVGRPRYTEYDAHYFPGEDVPLTRLSEPRNYSGVAEPEGRTVLCAELPCALGDEVWSAGGDELARRIAGALQSSGLPAPEPLVEVEVRRLPHAYPIYRRGFEERFARVDGWLAGREGLLSFGRQGLFAHDNTHHTLVMARSAVECLRDNGGFDHEEWARRRRAFEEHVVED